MVVQYWTGVWTMDKELDSHTEREDIDTREEITSGLILFIIGYAAVALVFQPAREFSSTFYLALGTTGLVVFGLMAVVGYVRVFLGIGNAISSGPLGYISYSTRWGDLEAADIALPLLAAVPIAFWLMLEQNTTFVSGMLRGLVLVVGIPASIWVFVEFMKFIEPPEETFYLENGGSDE
jgi:hypothetical protein